MAVWFRKDKQRWAAEFRDEHRRKQHKLFDRESDARQWFEDNRVAIRAGTYAAPSRETIGEMADQWLKRKTELGLGFHTLQNWGIHIKKYIKPELGEIAIQKATIKIIEEAAIAWKERCSAREANMVLKTLTSIFKLAQRRGTISAAGVNVAKEAERFVLEDEDAAGEHEILPEDVYTEEQLRKLIAATEPGSLERILLWLGGFCGLRIGEILGFTWPAIDLKTKSPKVTVIKNLQPCPKDKADFPGYGGTGRRLGPPKTKRSRRQIDAPRELVQDLRLWKLKCPATSQQIVMATVEGVPLQPKKTQAMFDELCARAEVPRRTLHRLRHTFGSLLINNGVPIPKVSRLLGHASAAFTWKVYIHFIDDGENAVQDLASRVLKQ